MRQFLKNRNIRAALRFGVLVILVAPALAACGGLVGGASDFINKNTKFTSGEYGVKASPRVTYARNTPKGGGRYQVGKPYKVAGKWYTPKDDPNYDKTGAASWYGPNFHGRQTANGEIFDQFAISAAHPTLPLPSYVRVTNLENNKSILVRVNDRGPFVSGREIDLSKRAAEMLDYINKGTARVRVKYVGRAPLEGDDTRMLVASLNKPTRMEESRGATTRVAFAEDTPASTRLEPMTGLPKDQGIITQTPEGFNIVNSSNTTELGPLFYAPTGFDGDTANLAINEAFAATQALAGGTTDLETWRKSVDQDSRAVRIELGVFTDQSNLDNLLQSFALIAAVDQDQVSIRGKSATRLTVTHLKPGVTRDDAMEQARRLGLNDVILYE